MTVVDDVVIKVSTEVDDAAVKKFEKTVDEIKKKTSKIPLTSSELAFNNLSKTKKISYLQNAVNNPSGNLNYPFSKDKALDMLSKLYNVEKLSEKDLSQIIELQKKFEGKKKQEDADTDDEGGLSVPDTLKKLIDIALNNSAMVAGKYREKSAREFSVASTAWKFGKTPEEVAKLEIAAKNVGLSFDEVAKSAFNFYKDLVENPSGPTAQALSSLGPSQFSFNKKLKTSDDMIAFQDNTRRLLERVYKNNPFISPVYGNLKSTELTGTDPNTVLARNNLFSKKNLDLADKIFKKRGKYNSSSEIVDNFIDVNAAKQQYQATWDKALDAGDVAKNITIGRANISSDIVNVTAGSVNILSDAVKKLIDKIDGVFKKPGGFQDPFFGGSGGPSNGAQIKAGGG